MKANSNIWDTIADGAYIYRLREVEIYYEASKLAWILPKAREIATARGYGITIDAYYEGQWLEMDVAYPQAYTL